MKLSQRFGLFLMLGMIIITATDGQSFPNYYMLTWYVGVLLFLKP